MKALLAIVLVAACAVSAQCLDLVLNNGKVYNDVRIVHYTPDGLDIVSHQDFDIMVSRHIRYNELSQQSLQNFPDYNKAKAEDYLASAKAWHEKSISSNKEAYTQWVSTASSNGPVVYPVPSADNMRIVFKATSVKEHGTVGWASTENIGTQVKHFGKIYIQGMLLPQDNEWIGTVYLTNKKFVDRLETCPCYATSKKDAETIDKREK